MSLAIKLGFFDKNVCLRKLVTMYSRIQGQGEIKSLLCIVMQVSTIYYFRLLPGFLVRNKAARKEVK